MEKKLITLISALLKSNVGDFIKAELQKTEDGKSMLRDIENEELPCHITFTQKSREDLLR